MKKFKFLTSVAMLSSILLITGCGGSSDSKGSTKATGTANEKEVRIAYNLPAEHATGIYFETLADEMEKRTKDTSIHLKPKTFPNGQLYNDAQLPDALTTNGVEIGQINIGFMAGASADPLRISDLPFLFNSWEAEWAAEDGEYGKLYGQQLEKMEMKLLGWPMYGTVELYGNEPIKVPKDVKGKKMRGFGQGSSLMLEELGASPVSMSSQEIYQGMEHGAIDGYTTGPSSVVERSLHEVSKYGTDMTMLYVSFQATSNLEWWNSLPKDVQDAVMEASKIAQEKSRQAAKDSDEEYKQKLDGFGVKQHKPTPEEYDQWVKASSKRYDAYLKKAGKSGKQLMKEVEKVNEQFPKQ